MGIETIMRSVLSLSFLSVSVSVSVSFSDSLFLSVCLSVWSGLLLLSHDGGSNRVDVCHERLGEFACKKSNTKDFGMRDDE